MRSKIFRRHGHDASGDGFGHDHRRQRAHALGADGRGFLEFHFAPRLLSVGINCALGPKEMRPYIEELSRIAPIYVSCYPNAGLPNPLSATGFPETPETMAPHLLEWARQRLAEHRGRMLRHDARAHSRHCRRRCKTVQPRGFRTVEPYLRLSGLEPLTAAARNQLRQYRRAHERHRFAEVRQADP